MTAPDAYVLPFEPGFDAPIGAVLECRGMSGWRCRDDRTGADVIVRDRQPNSHARHAGGMVGTLWRISDIRPHTPEHGPGFLVTLEPV